MLQILGEQYNKGIFSSCLICACGRNSAEKAKKQTQTNLVEGSVAMLCVRTIVKELLLRAASGEPWDPESSWPQAARSDPSRRPSARWLDSLDLPDHLPVPLECLDPCPGLWVVEVCNKGVDVGVESSKSSRGEGGSWRLEGFCDAAYALVCSKRHMVSGADALQSAKFNSSATMCALREVVPYSQRPERVQQLIVQMAATRGGVFQHDIAELLEWLWRHARVRTYRGWLASCCVSVLQAALGYGEGVGKLGEVCEAILTREGFKEGEDEVILGVCYVLVLLT